MVAYDEGMVLQSELEHLGFEIGWMNDKKIVIEAEICRIKRELCLLGTELRYVNKITKHLTDKQDLKQNDMFLLLKGSEAMADIESLVE